MYSELYAAWERETDDPALQPLQPDFYAQASAYIKRIREEIRVLDKKALKAMLLEQELKNVQRIIRQLTWARYKKITKLANENKKLPTELMTTEEAKLGKGYLPFLEGYRAFFKSLLQGQPPQINLEEPKELPRKRVVLRFVKAVPAIIGGDMKTYGPFVPEDVASVPIENAKLLIKQGFAVEVAVS